MADFRKPVSPGDCSHRDTDLLVLPYIPDISEQQSPSERRELDRSNIDPYPMFPPEKGSEKERDDRSYQSTEVEEVEEDDSDNYDDKG
jgi:hypothetical protein